MEQVGEQVMQDGRKHNMFRACLWNRDNLSEGCSATCSIACSAANTGRQGVWEQHDKNFY